MRDWVAVASVKLQHGNPSPVRESATRTPTQKNPAHFGGGAPGFLHCGRDSSNLRPSEPSMRTFAVFFYFLCSGQVLSPIR